MDKFEKGDKLQTRTQKHFHKKQDCSHLQNWRKIHCFQNMNLLLTDSIFENGAYGVPSKSQNPTVLGQGGPSSTQCSNPSWACRWHHPFGTNNYPPF